MMNRKNLLTRNSPHYTAIDVSAPLSVGNGRFCFTADVTGLQSLYEMYGVCPLCTMAEWGWHSYPDAPANDKALRLEMFDTYGRMVGYATDHTGQEELFYGLRQNNHKASLFCAAFTLDDAPLDPKLISDVAQELDLWSGVLTSSFRVDGEAVRVTTFAHPAEDTLCVRAESSLLESGRLAITVTFPYGSHRISGAEFSGEDRHKTVINFSEELPDGNRLRLHRRMDNLRYDAELLCDGGTVAGNATHRVKATPSGESLSLLVRLSKSGAFAADVSFASVLADCEAFWHRYWEEGAAIELAGSTDPRAKELERRIVLSQYLTAIQSRGQLPPAETGLTVNSWYGKFNVEMHCWHQAHFALWNRADVIERTLAWYKKTLPGAIGIAKSQGYEGARWPKISDESGYNSPSAIAVLLIWQQPHPIMMAELVRRNGSAAPEFLREYRDVVVKSAEFMVSFAHWDEEGSRYVLGAPYIPSQERFDPRTVLNAGFEVEYFRWGLKAAANWQTLLGEEPDARFLEVAEKLAEPVSYDGVYPAHENCPETYTELPFYTDHPSMTAMLGLLAGERVEPEIMEATLDKILEAWDLDSTWGWDFPMLAMTAARLGRTGQAIDFLMMDSPKNRYLANGHNMQGDKEDLPLYLPGNGSLLLAAGMMAAGWDGTEDAHAPGFPADGSFTVTVEGMKPYRLL